MTLDIGAYEQFVYIFKAIDAVSQVEQYTSLKRALGKTEATDDKLVVEALEEIKKELSQKEYDTYFYNKIEKIEEGHADHDSCFDGECTGDQKGYAFISSSIDLYEVKVGIGESEYSNKQELTADDTYKIKLAHRQSIISEDDIQTYITLPRIQKLDLADNKVGTLKGLEVLTELKELNAWKNLINDITTDMNWEAFDKIKVLNLGYNQISDIEVLEKLITLTDLDVSYNLLSGSFNFNLLNMKKLKSANFSHNQYNDIDYVNDQFILKALGYDEDDDGEADQLTVPEYLNKAGIDLNFQYQNLEIYATIVRNGDEFIDIDLPLIFQQLEEMDNDRTSFGETSQGGLVEPEGTSVRLKVPATNGDYKGVVVVEGRRGYEGLGQGYTTSGIGYGTTCTIYYTIIDQEELPGNPTNPDDPSKPDNPSKPKPDQPSEPIEYGYSVDDNYVYVYKPETKLTEFVEKIVDIEKYGVTVTENKSEVNIASGAVVSITDKTGEELYKMLETVVKGDINGDGEIDALDSGVIRKVVNDTEALVGVYESAADVNHDGDIDSQDSLLILQYRADRISSFEK